MYFIIDPKGNEPPLHFNNHTPLRIQSLEEGHVFVIQPPAHGWTDQRAVELAFDSFVEGLDAGERAHISDGADAFIGDVLVGSTEF